YAQGAARAGHERGLGRLGRRHADRLEGDAPLEGRHLDRDPPPALDQAGVAPRGRVAAVGSRREIELGGGPAHDEIAGAEDARGGLTDPGAVADLLAGARRLAAAAHV